MEQSEKGKQSLGEETGGPHKKGRQEMQGKATGHGNLPNKQLHPYHWNGAVEAYFVILLS